MRTIEWDSAQGIVKMIDQRRLPGRLEVIECRDYPDVARAIQNMTIRGAPAIGAAAAFGLALAARASLATSRDDLMSDLQVAARVLRATRPTAVNLGWALDRVLTRAKAIDLTAADLRQLIVEEAQKIADEDVEMNRAIARYGATLIRDGSTILTHCNTGALATVDIGTALGVIIEAHRQGKRIHVLVDETRPRLQGARLTAWELMQAGVPMTLIADGAAGHFMRTGRVQCVIVGADRVTANGDVANKVGTYNVAVLARENGIPFYCAFPSSTIDVNLPDGDAIPIEEREARELTHIEGVPIAPEGVQVANPAFDVTPNRYITALITERGVIRPPFEANLKRTIG